MLRLLFFIVTGALIAGGAIFFIQTESEVVINYIGYEITTTVPFFAATIIVFWVLFYYVLLVPLRYFGKRRKIKKIDSRNTKLYAMTLASAVAEDTKSFNKNLKKLWRSLNSEAKNATLVLELLVAKHYGAEEDFLKAAEILLQDDDFMDFASKEKVEFYRKKKDDKKALSYATDAYNIAKSHWVYYDLVELEIKEGSFERAEKYLEEGNKLKFIEKEDYRNLKSIILFMLSEMPYKKDEKESLLEQAHKLNPSHTIIAEKLANYYLDIGKAKRAQSVLEESFKLYPALPLYRVYIKTLKDTDDVAKLKMVEKLVADIDEDLRAFIMADIYMKMSLWGQASNELKKYIEGHELTPALCKMMSKIEKFSGIHYHLSECVVVESDEHNFDSWMCDNCGYISINGYKAQCDNCGAIGSIDWHPAP